MRVEKEEKFNHSRLVPQFWPRIPCYKADANERLNAVVERNVSLVAWVNHLQSAYFDEKSILNWTLQDDGGDPPHYTNCYKNPFGQITLNIPSPPKNDPQRGPASPRHKPWSETGSGTTHFEWVAPKTSLQWAGFQRLVKNLRAQGNEVLVIRGPFNDHIMARENLPAYRRLCAEIDAWFATNQIPQVAPEVLPSALYADASHPLTQGYELLAKRLYQDPTFQSWLRN